MPSQQADRAYRHHSNDSNDSNGTWTDGGRDACGEETSGGRTHGTETYRLFEQVAGEPRHLQRYAVPSEVPGTDVQGVQGRSAGIETGPD